MSSKGNLDNDLPLIKIPVVKTPKKGKIVCDGNVCRIVKDLVGSQTPLDCAAIKALISEGNLNSPTSEFNIKNYFFINK